MTNNHTAIHVKLAREIYQARMKGTTMLDMQSIEETRDELRALEARRDEQFFDGYFSQREAIGLDIVDMLVDCPPGLFPALQELAAEFKMRKAEHVS